MGDSAVAPDHRPHPASRDHPNANGQSVCSAARRLGYTSGEKVGSQDSGNKWKWKDLVCKVEIEKNKQNKKGYDYTEHHSTEVSCSQRDITRNSLVTFHGFRSMVSINKLFKKSEKRKNTFKKCTDWHVQNPWCQLDDSNESKIKL